MHIGVYVKNLPFLSDFNKILIFSIDFRKKIKLNENPFSRSRVVPFSRAAEGQTDMTKLAVAFGNSANAPKNNYCYHININRLISMNRIRSVYWI
jgi:hypothetical protein